LHNLRRNPTLNSAGYLPYLHASTPCQDFSTASSAHHTQEGMDASIAVFHAAMQLTRWMPVYTVENPAHGRLWEQWLRHAVLHGEQGNCLALLHRLDLAVVVNYCMYPDDDDDDAQLDPDSCGGDNQWPPKPTRVACSHAGVHTRINPRVCRFRGAHATTLASVKGAAARSAIPARFAMDVVRAVACFLREDLAPRVAAALAGMCDELECGVESIRDVKRVRLADGSEHVQYLVRWADGVPGDRETWEPRDNLDGAQELVDEFEAARGEGEAQSPREEFYIESILDRRVRRRRVEYLVRWEGDWPADEKESWQWTGDLGDGAKPAIDAFNASRRSSRR
jgi:hypothetical protein